MIEQIVKYLSPIAILGLIWGIVQFYQKRSHIKSDLKREEIRSVYKEIDMIISDIKNEYWKLIVIISQTSLIFKKFLDREEMEINIIKQKKDIPKFNSVSNSELHESIAIIENIEKESYNPEKHKAILEEQLKLAEIRKKEIKSSKNEAKKELAEIKAKQKEMSVFLEKNNQKLFEKSKETSKSLQELILNLNKISLVDVDEKYQLKSLITELTICVQKLINELEAEDRIDRINILEIIQIEKLEKTLTIISNIEQLIYKI